MRWIIAVFVILTFLMYVPPLLFFNDTNPILPYVYWVSISLIALVISWIEVSRWARKNV